MRLLLVLVAALLAAGPAAGAPATARPTLADLEDEVVCPTCETTLEMSNAPVADRMREFIRDRIEAGDSKEEIKASLVEQFGEGVLAAPPRSGFNLVAWLVPLAGGLIALGAVSILARRWLRTRAETPLGHGDPSSNGHVKLDAELERRVDEELARFDR